MSFDIHQLDDLEPGSQGADEAFEQYSSALESRFGESREFRALESSGATRPGWIHPFLSFGFRYLGKSVPRLSGSDVEEILTELFPRKVAFFEPSEAETVLPELIAFWRFVVREYRVPNGTGVLEYLGRQDQAEIARIMNDPERFGMAKAFVLGGRDAGFDMTDESDAESFAALYNLSVAAERERELDERSMDGASRSEPTGRRKAKRKAARASRKANIRRKKQNK